MSGSAGGQHGGGEAPVDARYVLLVDDSAMVRKLVSAVLRKHGWEVRCSSDAEEAAALALSSPPDVVVSDLWMPGVSGLQLCRLLRHSAATAEVPVVLLTASSSRRAQFWALESGAHAYLEKAHIDALPALLDRLAPAGGGRPKQSTDPVSRETVLARLGNLLDEALFASVLSHRLRGMASQQRTVAGLFAQTASLLGSVLPFHSVALSVPAEGALFVMAHPEDKQAAVSAREAFALPPGAPLELFEEEGCERGGAPTASQLYLLVQSDQVLGTLALTMAAHDWTDENRALIAVVTRELPMMLRPVQLLREMEHMALTDTLTKLPNRRAAMAALEQMQAASGRHQLPLSIALLDVDYFKRVNDVHGHGAGDRVLAFVAAMLGRAVRRSDLASRWGGEEFLLLLTHTAGAGACIMAERLRAQLAATPISLDDHTTLTITASIGVAEYKGETVEGLLHRADVALYEAKGTGRNRVVLVK